MLPTSEHFTLDQLADGVYAAIATPEGAAFSNAGIVDMGDHTLIFDTFDAPQAAENLRAAAEQLTGRSADYVVISHWHPDHWLGNQAFAGQATIIATHQTLEEMRPVAQEIAASEPDPSQLEQAILENQQRLETETDERWRAGLVRSISRLRHSLQALPILSVHLPNLTFETRLAFHGGRRNADLLTWGAGHTSSDCFLLLPEERIAFAGDLAFFHSQPFMPYCDPQAWITCLDKLDQLAVDTFVPGHGPLGTRADIALQRQYLVMLEEMVADAIRAGRPVEETLRQPLPTPFDTWLMGGMGRFEANVQFLYQRLSPLPPTV